MNAEDFHDLYKLLRGSRSAFAILDARTLFTESKMQAALAKVQESRDSYEQSRSRLMKTSAEKQVDRKVKDADRQIRRIERKQEKVREILAKFDEILPSLGKLAEREKSKQPKEIVSQNRDVNSATASALTATIHRPASPTDVSIEFAARFIESEGDRQLELISRHFGFRPVESEDDIHANAVYFIKIQDESFLVHTTDAGLTDEGVPLVSAVDEIPMKTYSREAFLRLGERKCMVLLTTDAEENVDSIATEDYDSMESFNDTQEIEAYETVEVRLDEETQPSAASQTILDMGDFSQLMDAAQRSGLVPAADQIAHYRDREFRLGCYELALTGLEGMFASFTGAAAQFTQRINREEQEIKSGKMKISPKELQAKRARDRQQTQAIERARGRFQRVINGLQVLIQEQ